MTIKVRGLSNSGRIELPCLVDQVNCGEVYYITWTKQSLGQSNNTFLAPNTQNQPAGQQWTRVYLYTGANDSAPHKPIGDLLNRASFVMPSQNGNKQQQQQQQFGNNKQLFDEDVAANNNNNNNNNNQKLHKASEQAQHLPMAHLIIEQPKISDEALYKCDVTYVKGKCPSISLVRVQILALPAKAQILITPNMPQQIAASGNLDQQQQQHQQQKVPAQDGQMIGPFNEHDQLSLTCLVHGGRPQARSVLWRKIDSTSGRVTNLLSNQRQSIVYKDKEREREKELAPTIQVDLNYTLGSLDMNSKFECHIEHEALDLIVSNPLTRFNNNNNNNQATSISKLTSEILPTTSASASNEDESNQDSMLDLHPSAIRPTSSLGKQIITSDNIIDQNLLNSDSMNSRSLDSHVTVDLNVGVSSLDLFMTKVNKRNSSELLKEGDLIELECIAYNSKPPANITWFNGPDIIEQLDSSSANSNNNNNPVWQQNQNHLQKQINQRHKRLLQRNQVHQNDDRQTFNTHSFLSIKLSRHEHKAQIVCQAQNSQMRQPLIKSLELQVQHAPIVLMEPASGIIVNELQTPSNLNSNSNLMENSMDTSSGSESSNLFSATTSRQLNGFTDNNNKISNNNNNQVNIYCIYTANPSELLPDSTRWFKNGLPLNVLENNRPNRFIESTTTTGYPVLTINHVNRRDAGHYDCQVANLIGLSERLANSEACKLEVNFRPTVKMRIFKPIDQQKQAQLQTTANNQQHHFDLSDLIEIDLNHELVLPGNSYVLMCDVIEAQPSKIQKFYWFKRNQQQQQQQQQNVAQQQHQEQDQLLSITEVNQFVLNILSANFSPASFTCSASNSLGVSDNSKRIDLQLSYSPGPSIVRPIIDAAQRKNVLVSGKTTTQAPTESSSSNLLANEIEQISIAAGKELLLECLTLDLGQPRANIWLWFKNGQPIESSPNLISQSSSYNNNNIRNISANNDNNLDELISNNDNSDNNPIRRHEEDALRAVMASIETKNQPRTSSLVAKSALPLNQETSILSTNGVSLLGSGRYLFISSIQLAHKGNYSCVAVNRLGSGQQQQQQQQFPSSTGSERDSYFVNVTIAPSFVRPLPQKTYWSEEATQNGQPSTLELVCHVQCEPICQIEWYKNNELLDLKKAETNYLNYQIKQSIMDENLSANLFKSIESRLLIQFESFSPQRDSNMKILERRNLLSGTNYSCQSSSNSFSGYIKSTTKFIVEYPPENVIIDAPSDKLNLIEGSNGPKFVCGASAEPPAQYRWFLVRSTNRESVLHKTKNNNNNNNNNNLKSSPEANNGAATLPTFQSINNRARKETTSAPEQPINQLDNKALQQNEKGIAIGFSKGANDGVIAEILDSTNLIELTSSTTTKQTLVGGSLTSTLDFSNMSMDRKQTGYYICEASNKLGRMRQSVYVNIQYKPVCASLHLYSLDMIMGPSKGKSLADNNINMQYRDFNYIQIKPTRATSNDEYSIVQDTNEDYVNLRRMLITSPLSNDGISTTMRDGQSTFKNSVFQTILNNEKNQRGPQPLQAAGSMANDRVKAQDALIHLDDDVGQNNNNDIYSEIKKNLWFENNNIKNSNGNSWDGFNDILLKFLNSYVKQVKDHENKFIETINNKRIAFVANKEKQINNNNNNRQNRRSQASEKIKNDLNYDQDFSIKNLITFACVAQDANPNNNLTFDWYFGSINLKENLIEDNNFFETSFDSNTPPEVPNLKLDETSKPILLYSNENYTLHVILVRRFDTKSRLNPFQMSLLTLNVILEPQQQINDEQHLTKYVRQVDDDNNGNVNKTLRAPVIRNRYQSLYNSVNGPKANKNNIQFTQEFYTKPYNVATPTKTSNMGVGIELNEHNWEEQIGNFLKCSVANKIGVSDVCSVQLNVEERSKGRGLWGQGSLSTTFEFSKWGVPSLAYKSLLSILIFCALIIISISAFILGPYIKYNFAMRFMKNNNDNDNANEENNKADSNTAQSTSSQKSSILGLLGDNSTQGSSDDDSTARITNRNQNQNHHHHHQYQQQQQQQFLVNDHKMSNIPDIMMDRNPIMTNTYQYNQQQQEMLRESYLCQNYDEPRSSYPAITDDDETLGQNYNERTPDTHLPNSSTYKAYSNGLSSAISKELDADMNRNSNTLGSSASRLLANLRIKSLSSKFKVDRISDLTNSFRGNLHTKTISNSGTNTTALSSNFSDNNSTEQNTVSKLISPTSSNNSSTNFFNDSNLRHSYSAGFRRTTTNYLSKPTNNLALSKQANHVYDQNGLKDLNGFRHVSKLNQRNSSILDTPTYLNMMTNLNDSDNPMDRFIRERELLKANDSFYRSQSVRNHDQATFSTMSILAGEKNLGLHQHQHQQQQQQPYDRLPQQELQNVSRGPPVYPRTMYARNVNHGRVVGGVNQSTMLHQRLPQITAKPRNHLLNNNTPDYNNRYHYSSNNNQSAMLPYNQPRIDDVSTYRQPVISTISYNINTIDSHLNRLTENNAIAYYQNQQQLINYANNNGITESGTYNDHENLAYNNQTELVEHIYDTNAYATPEQTPLKKLYRPEGNNDLGEEAMGQVTKPRVSQLIQSFNSKVPE